jgi:glucose/arabinose dehydrogenase
MRAKLALIGLSILAWAATSAPTPAFPDSGGTLLGAAAYGDWRTDAPGVRRKLTPADMPAPFASPPAANQSEVVARPDGVMPKVPPGFAVAVFAKDLKEPRVVRIAPNGDIFVAETGAGSIRVFRTADGSATPSISQVFASKLHRPFGIAFYPPGPDPHYVYVASTTEVVRYPRQKHTAISLIFFLYFFAVPGRFRPLSGGV